MTTTSERMRQLSNEERERHWAIYREIVDREIDGKPEPGDALQATDQLGYMGVVDERHASDVYEGHVKARRPEQGQGARGSGRTHEGQRPRPEAAQAQYRR